MVRQQKPIMRTIHQTGFQRERRPDLSNRYAAMTESFDGIAEQCDRADHITSARNHEEARKSAHAFDPQFDPIVWLNAEEKVPWLTIPWEERRRRLNRRWHWDFCENARSACQAYHRLRTRLQLPVPKSKNDCKAYLTFEEQGMDPEDEEYQHTLVAWWYNMRDYGNEPAVGHFHCRTPEEIAESKKVWERREEYIDKAFKYKMYMEQFLAMKRFLDWEYLFMQNQ